MPGMPERFMSSSARPPSMPIAASTRPGGMSRTDPSLGGTLEVRVGDPDRSGAPQATRINNISASTARAARWITESTLILHRRHHASNARGLGGSRRSPERAPVDRHEQPPARTADVEVRADGFLGIHVYVAPERVIRTDRQQTQVERAMFGADAGEALRVTGVAAEIGAVLRSCDHPRGPQRRVATHEAAGEMPGGCAHQCQVIDGTALSPV